MDKSRDASNDEVHAALWVLTAAVTSRRECAWALRIYTPAKTRAHVDTSIVGLCNGVALLCYRMRWRNKFLN